MKIQVIHNDSLLMFYCTSIMKDWIYYTSEYDAVVIAEQDHGRLRCMDVYCDQGKNLLDILASVADADAKTVSLEFTPCMILSVIVRKYICQRGFWKLYECL